MVQGFRTTQACDLTGATYRQADHWSRLGILVPTIEARGSGSARVYTRREVQAMWALAQLSTLSCGPGPSLEVRQSMVATLLDAPEFSGYLLATCDRAVVAAHVLDLADQLTELEGPVVVLDLDRCPVQQEVLVS